MRVFLVLFAAAIAMRQSAPASTGTATGSATGVISGVVIDGSTSLPVGGAVVSLGESPRPVNAIASRQITDAKGRFVFTGLRPSKGLTLNASRAGYFDGRFSQFDRATPPEQMLALADGEWLRDVRLVLWKNGGVEGTVRDEAGEGVAAIEVRTVAIVRLAGRDQLAEGPSATTDDRGRYRITGLLPGRYLVAVPSMQTSVAASSTDADLLGMTEQQLQATTDRPAIVPTIDQGAGVRVAIGRQPTPPVGSAARGYPLMFSPGTTAPNPAAALDIRPGDFRTADISLVPAPTVWVTGRLVGPEQVANRLVRLLSVGAETLGFGFETAATRTDADGRFRLANVPVGEYVLDVPLHVDEYQLGGSGLSAEGQRVRVLPGLGGYIPNATAISGAQSGLGFFSEPADRLQPRVSGATAAAAPLGWSRRMPVTVSANGTADLMVPLTPAATIAGRVRFTSDTAALAPFQMTISLKVDPASGSPTEGQASALVDRTDHTFAITGVLPARYFLRLGLGPGWSIQAVAVGGRDYTNSAIDVSAAARVDNVEVTLTRATATIAGAVANSGAAPGSRVCVFPVDRSRWTDFGVAPPWLASAPISQLGTYSISGLPAGEYYVAIVPPAETETWRDIAFFARVAAASARLTVAGGETRNQDLRMEGR